MRRGETVRVRRAACPVAHVVDVSRRVLAHREHPLAGLQRILEGPPVIRLQGSVHHGQIMCIPGGSEPATLWFGLLTVASISLRCLPGR